MFDDAQLRDHPPLAGVRTQDPIRPYHHGPHSLSVAPMFYRDPLTTAFVSDLTDLVLQADLWLHGHLHCAHDYVHLGCRVVANPFGYARKNEQVNFDPLKIVCVEV